MDVGLLIQEVSKRRPLWDSSHPQHHNRFTLDKAWDEVSKIMKQTVKTIRIKWKYLRDQYRKEIKKIYSPEPGAHPHEPTWTYFPTLRFLREQMAAKELGENALISKQTEDSLISYVDDSSNQDLSSDIIQLQDEPPRITFEDPADQESFRAPKRSFSNSDIDVKLLNLKQQKLDLLTKQHTSTQQDNKCDDYHYFMSLLPVMKKFNYLEKMRIRNKFQQAILEELTQLSEFQPTATASSPLSYESASSHQTLEVFEEFSGEDNSIKAELS